MYKLHLVNAVGCYSQHVCIIYVIVYILWYNVSKNHLSLSLSVIRLQIKRTVDFETNLNNDWVIRPRRFIGTMLLIYV